MIAVSAGGGFVVLETMASGFVTNGTELGNPSFAGGDLGCGGECDALHGSI